MPEVTVAVIDSGIHAAHPHIGVVADGVGIDADGREHPDFIDRLGHGTAVAAAIRDLAPAVRLLAVKVFDCSLDASVPALTAAIDWSAHHRADLINLSLGVANPAHAGALARAVQRARTRGCVVVSAGCHEGVPWLPGTLDGVLRVELDWTCVRGEFRCVRTPDTTVFRTCGYPRPIDGLDPEQNLKGLSFAVANVTGAAASLMSERPVTGLDELIERLAEAAAV